MTVWTLLWIAWLLAFLVIEGLALANTCPGDTLSETVWAWCSLKDKGPWWRLRRLAAVVLLAWLSLHILTGGAF